MKCRLCGKGANEIRGILARVNEKGVAGIWECRPICGAELDYTESVAAAIDGRFEQNETNDDFYCENCERNFTDTPHATDDGYWLCDPCWRALNMEKGQANG